MDTAAGEQDVAELGRALVGSLAPAELPLFGAVSRAFFEAGGRVRHGRGGGDEILGFGAGEAAALLTPAALAAVAAAGGFVADEVRKAFAKTTAEFIGEQVRRVFRREPAALALTAPQLARVRALALDAAKRVKLPEEKAALLADALVGCLATGGGPG
jgi:hypothetical protein